MTLNSIRSLTLPLVLASAFLMTAVPSKASSILELVGTGNNNYNGIPAFPYDITVNGGTPLPMMCDDAETAVWQGYSWTANPFALTAANVPNLKFASMGSASTVLNDYEMAAYIESGVVTGSIAAGDGNAAVWSIFDPKFSTSFDHANIVSILNNAQAAVNAGNLNYSGITIWTPSPLRSSQEFIYGIVTTTHTPQGSVPEPATFAMLGGGLLALALVGRLKTKGQQDRV